MANSHSDHSSCCPPESGKNKPWYKRQLPLLSLGIAVVFVASLFIKVLVPFRTAFIQYAEMMAWPIGLGFIAGGLIDHYVPREYISKHLALSKKRTVVYSTFLGFLMSACSHGILTLSVELYKKGASIPAVISFLLASPWANLPITFLLIGFFGLKGIVIIVSALIVAIVTGLIFQILAKYHLIEDNPHTVNVDADFSIRRDVIKRIQDYSFSAGGVMKDIKGVLAGAWDLAEMVLGWTLIGMILASLSSAFVPSHFFHQYFGPNALGLLVTIVVATVLEVCSEGTAPMAFEIYKQTGAFGNVFAFLMGGVVTDYTEIGVLWTRIGKKTALWMLAISLPQVILLGLIFNWVF